MNKCEMVVLGAVALVWLASASAADTPPLKRSEEISFAMRDGTLFRGKMDVKILEVDTLYGKLTVPVADVIRIRIGKNANRDLKARIDKLVADLANKDFRIREEAQKELGKLGKLAYAELETASHSPDTEVKERATALLADIRIDEDEELQPSDDEIVTPTFTIGGTMKLDAFTVVTKFGSLKVDKKDVLMVTMAEPEFTVRTVSVTGRNVTSGQWLDTGMRVKKGDRIILNASGAINWPNMGQGSEPAGNEGWGVWRQIGNQQIHIGALVGKIGAGGALFLVGEKYNDKVTADGVLSLAIASNWGGGQMPSNGEYKVKIEVRPGSASGESNKPKPVEKPPLGGVFPP